VKNLKNLRSKINRGFTMIELLIVIAVLGVLAIAVLATFNPIEQINRGRDTSSRSDSEQMLTGIDRYNANRGLWPWQNIDTDPDEIDPPTLIAIDDPAGPGGDGCSMLQNLGTGDAPCSGTDEVKQTFVTRVVSDRTNDLWIYYRGNPGDSVYVCFNPQSKAFAQEAQTRCEDVPDDFPASWACEDAGGDCPDSLGQGANCLCLP
jgi:prepilin-type N-terminal cleavage/methylation domain-containing protein